MVPQKPSYIFSNYGPSVSLYYTVIQKSCSPLPANEMQCELVSILFHWIRSLYRVCLRFALTQWIIADPWKPAARQRTGPTDPPPPRYAPAVIHLRACVHARSTRLHIRACRGTLTWRLMGTMRRWLYAIFAYFLGFKCSADRQDSLGSQRTGCWC